MRTAPLFLLLVGLADALGIPLSAPTLLRVAIARRTRRRVERWSSNERMRKCRRRSITRDADPTQAPDRRSMLDALTVLRMKGRKFLGSASRDPQVPDLNGLRI